MCLVSNVHDYGRNDWEKWNPPPRIYPATIPFEPHTPNVIPFAPATLPYVPPVSPPTGNPFENLDKLKEWLDAFRKAVEAAQEFDKRTGQPHCEDPKKLEWMQAVEERLKKLEAAAAAPA